MRVSRLAAALGLAAGLVACPEAAGQHAPQAPGPALPGTRAASLAAIDALSLRRPTGPEWFGLYLMGKKAGWTAPS